MGHQAGFQEAVVDLYGNNKLFAMLAQEFLDGLLLRIGIEINDGPLVNVLNMALFLVLKKIDHM